MKNKNSKARMQVIFGTLLFALILMAELYTMINYSKLFVAIAVFAVVDLGCLYVVINGILIMKEQKELRREEQYDSIFKSEKASYLMLKKYFEEIEDKLNYLEKVAKVPTEEIINAQKGIAKVIITRNRENAEAMMNSNDLVMEQIDALDGQMKELNQAISDNRNVMDASAKEIESAVNAGRDAVMEGQKRLLEANENDLQIRIQELTVSLKDMELRLNSAIMQSQKIIAQAPVMTASIPVAAPVQQATPATSSEPPVEPLYEEPIEELVEEPIMPEPSMEETPFEDIEASDLDDVLEDMGDSLENLPDELPETEVSPDELPEEDLVIDTEDEPLLTDDEVNEMLQGLGEDLGVTAEEPIPEPEPVIEPEPIVEPEPIPEAEEKPSMPDLSDPNKMMSPDDIAALFANMGGDSAPAAEPVVEPEPIVEPESIPEAEEKPSMPDLSDPNKMMSPDDIAALFANMGGDSAPAAEPVVEPEPIVEPEPMPEPVVEEKPPMPDLSDPNKSLSPDEIAALFANLG